MSDSRQQGHESNEDFSKLLGESLEQAEKTYSPGDRVRAELLSVGTEDSFVALGPGKEGVLSTADLRDAEGRVTRRSGETLDLFVTSVRAQEVRLSVHPTDKNIAEDLQEAFSSRRPIEGRVVEACKGGLRVSVKGKLAFCPISQIDAKRTETGAEFIGKTFAFRITELSEGGRNIVLSRRKLLEEEASRTADAFLAQNLDGSLVTGKVVRLEKFGAFVELAPGLEGLLHVSELAWSRVESPSELLKAGQTITVKLLKREMVEDRLKLSLSLKQATEAPAASPVAPAQDPWAKYQAGQAVTGKITRKEPYGLFVQLEPGIVGLLHQSKTVDRADFRLEQHKVGESIEVQIGEVKLGERRIALELPRDTSAEEWREQQKASEGQFGALGDVFKAALKAKKR
ncbi:MAG: S1 RNA-binding domain-containing protein [Elusimicrobia bacterium]|nr:S1 RNA-binding domain-containing protein [Elusimicrobiota bacterium]